MDQKKILLIEDDRLIAELYQRTLTNAGFLVETALDGETGMNKAALEKFDLILLDIMLPNKTGIEVLEEVKKGDYASKDAPVIIISNLGQEEIIQQCLSKGAVGYMVKSQNLPDDIVKKVKEFFASKSS